MPNRHRARSRAFERCRRLGGVAAHVRVAARRRLHDRAAEQARLVQIAEQLEYALRSDDLDRQMYQYVK